MSVNITLLHTEGVVSLLFTDPSASHLAYCLLTLDLAAKEAFITHIGMLWTRSTWSRGQRFKYMQRALEKLINGLARPLDGCVTEAFFANPKLMFGSSVIPTVNAFIEMACSAHKAGYLEIGPPSWRSVLSVKAIKDETGKKDYKGPTKTLVELTFGQLPEKILSNLDQKERKLPNDIPDCLAIALAYCKVSGVTQIKIDPNAYTNLALLNELALIGKEI